MGTIWRVLTRRKVLTPDATDETPLARVLNTFDLTALGVGSTLGVGVYVLAGQVAKNTAGPAVIISFLIAAVASVFAGLCYAEFGARTPRAGSAYIYSYLCVGEFIAFVIGWNLILEYVIGSASVAKGLSSYIDNLLNGTMSNFFTEIAPIGVPYLSPYFDLFAFGVSVILAIALAFGMKESSLVNNIFTTVNIGVVLFVIIAGSFNVHLSNWFIKPEDVKNVTNGTVIGDGGFFPFGIEGVVKGAATCFYGFVGFDCIATTGEEVKNPKKAIPISIILSLFIIFLAYFGTSTVITLMVPYYEQNPTAPIPFAFESIHWHTAAVVVTIGAMFGLYASLFGAMFPLPRILYAMANDGLIFKFMGRVNERFKTPVIGTLLAGLFTGIMAAVFNLESLVNMMSIGTLLAYTIVAACVLLLRYSVDEKNYTPISNTSDSEEIEGYTESNENTVDENDETGLTTSSEERGVIRQIFNFGRTELPTKTTETIVSINIFIYCVLCFLLGICALTMKHRILHLEVLPLIAVAVILILIALILFSIVTQPVSRKSLSFQVPCVPLIPALSILFNIYLMIMLDIATWIRFVVWMAIGLPTFYLTRRQISKNREYNVSQQGRQNNGFYDENLVYSNNSDTFSNQETIVVTELEKKVPPLKIFEQQNENSDVLSPSPSRVIETLDLVLESFVTRPASPSVVSADVSSALHESSASDPQENSLGDFRDTPNTAMRTQLLNTLNSESEENVPKETVDEPAEVELQNQETVDENAANESVLVEDATIDCSEDSDDFDRVSTSESETSYLSASSEIDLGTSVVKEELATPPPPPPPMAEFDTFKRKPKFERNVELKQPREVIERSKMIKNQSPMIINRKSLNSVKLKHVRRPSLDCLKPNESDEVETSNETPRTGQYLRSKSYSEQKYINDDQKNKKDGQNINTLPKISKEAINSVKLKPVFRPSLSLNDKSEPEKPDSVKFGTPEFEQFKGTLNEKLKNPVKILRAPTFVDPKKVAKKNIEIDRENVIEDRIDVKKARATMQAEVDSKLNKLKGLSDEPKNVPK